jgi:hypothetical protein
MADILSFNSTTTEYTEITDSTTATATTTPPNPPPSATWTAATNTATGNTEFFTSNGTNIAFGNNIWVALGTDVDGGGLASPKIYYSTNGISWTASGFAGWSPTSVKNVEGLFCLIGEDAGRMRIDISTDGNIWTNIPGNGMDVFPSDGGSINDVIFDGTNWIVVGRGTGTQVYYSASINSGSAAWKPIDVGFSDPGSQATVRSIIYTGSQYVITGTNTLVSRENIAYADAPLVGSTWTSLTAFDNAISPGNGGTMVVYSASATPRFIAIGNINGDILTSADGRVWNTNTPAGGITTVSHVILGDGGWFVIGQGGLNNVLKITGLTTSIGYPIFDSINSGGRYLAYGNGKMWAVGIVFDIGGQNAYYLLDGASTWVAASVPLNINLANIVFGNGTFVATGTTQNNQNIQYTT